MNEGLIIIIGVFLFSYLFGKISESFEETKAEKEVPLVLNEIDNLNIRLSEYLKYESYIDESVKQFRSEYERKKTQRAYFAERKPAKPYRRQSKRYY